MKQGQKTTVVKSRGTLVRKSFKWFFLVLGGVFFMLLCAGGIVVYFLSGESAEQSPVAQSDIDEFLNAVKQPEDLDDTAWNSLHSLLGKIPDKVRKPLIRIVTKKSIEELKGNFKGLKTEDEKKRKVREIMDDIERSYAISGDTYKVFNEEFIREGLGVYMKEVSPEERALYDPIVHTFIRKMNSKRNEAKR